METLNLINRLKAEHSRILEQASYSLDNTREHLDEVTSQLIQISDQIDELFEQLSPTEVCLYIVQHFYTIKAHVLQEMMAAHRNPTIQEIAEFAVQHGMVEELCEEYHQIFH